MNAASSLTGAGDGFDAGLGLLLWAFISPVGIYIFQMNLNKVWEAQRSISAAPPAAAIETAEPTPAVDPAPAEGTAAGDSPA